MGLLSGDQMPCEERDFRLRERGIGWQKPIETEGFRYTLTVVEGVNSYSMSILFV
jgi:hypothetical protein